MSLLVADLEPLAPPPTTIVSSFIVESSQALDSEFEAFQGQALTWQSQRYKVQRLSEMLYQLHRAVVGGEETQRNCALLSLAMVIFQTKTKTSGKQFVLQTTEDWGS